MKSIIRNITAALSSLAFAMSLAADTPKSLSEIPLKDIDGKSTSLKAYEGKVLLLVNVASKCGYTKQYAGLEKLHAELKTKGFSVLGFPCNDFGAQEPGSEAEIKEFCSTKFNVTFPLFEKLHVKGSEQHPLYASLTGTTSPVPGPVKWNFGKFLIGKKGEILKRFDSGTEPDSEELRKAIDEALAAK